MKAKLDTSKAFRRLARDCVTQFADHEAGAARRDAESLHKMRVGVRRLRSVFTTFRPALAAEQVGDLRRDLHWLQGVLGRCRDWDVLNTRNLVPLRDRLSGEEPLQRFAGLGADAREHAYDTLEHALATRRRGRIRDRLRALLDEPEAAGTR